MGMNQGASQTTQSFADMIDHIKVASINTISGRAEREYSSAGYVGELTVRLPDGSRLELSHYMDPGCPGGTAEMPGRAPAKIPTVVMTWENSDKKVRLHAREAEKVHRAVTTRIGYQRANSEQWIALWNAEILLNPEKFSWVRCEGSKGEEVFRTKADNVNMWLSHTVTSFFGFKRHKYELVGCFNCDLFDAASRYTDDRARILFQRVSSELNKPVEDVNSCQLPKM